MRSCRGRRSTSASAPTRSTSAGGPRAHRRDRRRAPPTLTPQAFENDRRRDAVLSMLGFRTLRFTWRQVGLRATSRGAPAVERSHRAGSLPPGWTPTSRSTSTARTHELTVDVRTTLLDLLREHLGLTGARRAATTASAARARSCIDGRRANAASRSRSPTTAPSSRPSRGSPTATSCTRCRRRSSSTTRSSAATARPGQLCSAVGHARARRSRTARRSTRREIRERMSGNICRCGAYPNIVAAIADTVA